MNKSDIIDKIDEIQCQRLNIEIDDLQTENYKLRKEVEKLKLKLAEMRKKHKMRYHTLRIHL